MLLLVLTVAAGLRLHRLPQLPLGLHYDEAANGILAAEIAQGLKTPVFIPSYTGKEVLFFYWTALWMKLLGPTALALRLSAALAGLATVAATVWAVRELIYGTTSSSQISAQQRYTANWIALTAGAFLATSFWHLVLSRYGFRAVTQPLLQALTVAALWRGLRLTPPVPPPNRGWLGGGLHWLILAGLFCGLTAYTYLAARAFPIPLAAALLTLLVTTTTTTTTTTITVPAPTTDRRHRRARLGQLILFGTIAALTLAPLVRYWLGHPGSFTNRIQQVAPSGWDEVWSGIRACLGMFFLRGDPYVRFNIPHRPLFNPITAALFLLGLLITLRQLIRLLLGAGRPSAPPLLHLASCIFLLTYLPTMLLPSALAVGDVTPSNLRAAGLLPFVYVFPALGLWAILDTPRRILPPASRLLPLASRILHPASRLLHPASCLLLLALSGFATARAYFGQWATSAELYYATDGDLTDVAAYLNQTEMTAATPYVASVHYRHPTLAFLVRNYEDVRWLTGGRTVVFPAQGKGRLIFPRSASGDLAWVESVLPEGSLAAAPAGPDGRPAFHVYHVSSDPGLTPPHPLEANLGYVVSLLGYETIGQPRSGESAQVAVWWQVLNAPDQGDYGPLARIADPWGFTWGETQPFHYPSEQWTPGELVVDHLSIPVSSAAPPGDYTVRVSFYSPASDSRLPVLDDSGRYSGTTVELPLSLARAASPPDPQRLHVRRRLDTRTDGLTLLGLNLDTDEARPGEPLFLTLFWRAEETSLPAVEVTLTLSDALLYTGAPVHGSYPTSEWTAGEVVADRYSPRIPRNMPPGDHRLRLHAGALALDLGTVTVHPLHRVFDAPPISHPTTVTLGSHVRLLGYDLSPTSSKENEEDKEERLAPGETLVLTLYWQALTEMNTDYTVFVHLVAPDGTMAAQQDRYPVNGTYPTSLWITDEIVADRYEIPIRADAASGPHRLKTGMYVAENGARLPVAGTPDDAITLQTVTIAK